MAADRVGALILAGGASARMGRAKALLEWNGRSFVAGAVARVRAAGCAPVIVVDGAHRLARDLPGLADVERVHNEHWQLGPLSSMQLGLRRALALAPALDGVLTHRVEQPRVQVETLAKLIAALREQPDMLWQPSVGGRSGHPLLWPRVLFEPLLALDPTHESARTLVRGPAAGLRRKLEVDDLGVLDNIDTPADLARLVQGQ